MIDVTLPSETEDDSPRVPRRLDVVVGVAVSACVSVLLAGVSLAVRIQTLISALKSRRSTR